ncbi:MAG: HP0495 family protein, partial [Campylobacterota bacterium]
MVCLRQKAKIEYPCRWSYKIIAQKKDHIEVIAQKVCPPEYELKHSNNSKSGKYVSM